MFDESLEYRKEIVRLRIEIQRQRENKNFWRIAAFVGWVGFLVEIFNGRF